MYLSLLPSKFDQSKHMKTKEITNMRKESNMLLGVQLDVKVSS